MNRLQRRVAAVFASLSIVLLYATNAFRHSTSDPGPRIVLHAPEPKGSLLPAELINVDPTLIKPLSAEAAVKENNAIDPFKGPIEPSRPFVLPARVGLLSMRSAVDCLTAAVYYESAGQLLKGQRAVAQVVLNRLRHPAYPKSVCGVVFQGSERQTGCQFTFTCDGSLARKPPPSSWEIARRVAQAALSGKVEPSVGTSTHYHTVFVVPYWASSLQKITTLGAHVFYRFPGYWGMRHAFSGVYAGEMPPSETEAAFIEYARLIEDAKAHDALAGGAELILSVPAFIAPAGGTLDLAGEASLRADENKGSLLVDESRPQPNVPGL